MSAPEGAVSWTAAALAGSAPPLGEEQVQGAVAAAAAHGGASGLRVDVVFVSEDELARMHGEYLGDPSATDVITFDLRGDGPGGDVTDPGPDGELYVSLPQARREAEVRGVLLARELCLYVVHGTLHLCGLDDQAPEERAAMRAAEAAVLRDLGFEDDERPHGAS